jgi:hypothetical protein
MALPPLELFSLEKRPPCCRDVALLVEQLIRNQLVIGSSPIVGSIDSVALLHTTPNDSSISFPCSCIQFGTALSTVFFLYRLRWS